MKKIVCFVAGLLILSGFAAISLGEKAGDQQETINLNFSNIEIVDSTKEPYIEINIDGAGGRLYRANAPILPMHTTKMTLPFGTKITSIECQTGQVQSMEINEKIVPAPKPAITGIDDASNGEYIMDETIYNSNELFPNDWFEYYTGGGLDENLEHKTFLNLRVFPVRYSPGTNTVHYIEDIEATINYKEPDSNPFPLTTEYDMVIIAPSAFQSSLQKLVTHKNDMGVKTTLKTTEEIYSEQTGYDKPEEIKLFIRDAIETWNIKYVLLVGGMKSLLTGSPRDNLNEGTKDWHVPARYANIKESGGTHDPGLLSDLYYADIYDGDGAFDDWDSNNDHIYAKWHPTGVKDTLDLYPDVSLGRLACRSTTEVNIMVNKIVNYEKGARGTSWYNKIILIGGDSFNDVGTNYLEGEVVAEKIWGDYMTEFTPVKLYASNKISNPSMTPTGTNIKREITKGAGHVFFDGHANPASWTTHWPGEFQGGDSWTERFMIFDMPWLFNFGKLPVCCVEGCHNSQFNVTVFYTLFDKDNSKHSWCYGLPVPECWSWWLARKIGGGSLATIGNTGLGYGAVGEHGDLDGDGILEPDICEKLGGFYFLMVYEAFDEGYDMLGDAWAMAHTKYLDVHPGMDYQIDAKEMEELALLGDPSLKIGGYPKGIGFEADILDASAGVIGAPSEEVILQAAAYNGEEPYTFEWDFDNDGVYDDADGEIASWTWNIPGVRWVSLKASDNDGEVDIFDTLVSIEFGASTPSKPSGETKIKANKPYTYETTINTQGGYWNHLYYKFDWGDEEETDWVESSKATHTWWETGTYKIKVKAMLTHETSKGDPEDAEDFKESDWSDPLTITVTRGRSRQIFNHPLIQLLQKFFENYPNAFPILQQLLGM